MIKGYQTSELHHSPSENGLKWPKITMQKRLLPPPPQHLVCVPPFFSIILLYMMFSHTKGEVIYVSSSSLLRLFHGCDVDVPLTDHDDCRPWSSHTDPYPNADVYRKKTHVFLINTGLKGLGVSRLLYTAFLEFQPGHPDPH